MCAFLWEVYGSAVWCVVCVLLATCSPGTFFFLQNLLSKEHFPLFFFFLLLIYQFSLLIPAADLHPQTKKTVDSDDVV